MTDSMFRVLPELLPENTAFWTGGADGELRITRCQQCRYWIHPPTIVCPNCLSREIEPEVTSGRGTVFSFAVSHQVAHPDVPVPYVIALVELDEQPGLRLTTNVVGCEIDDVRVGMPVHVVFEQHDDVFVPVFAPD
jgi:uncharacterized protein